MTQQLYLLRHAEAEAWNPLGNDFSRPLSPFGARHAQLLSSWAFASLSSPETILCSPAKRTRETLAPLLAHWPRLLSATNYADSMYGASLDMLLTLAEDAFSYSESLMMVGHNPGIRDLLVSVLRPDQVVSVGKMDPGTLAIIEFPDQFRRHTPSGDLIHLIRRDGLSIN